jgi:predicted nucleotidyltransferase
MKHTELRDGTTPPAHSRFLKQVIDTAIRYVDPERIILYGSRARGSGGATSDYDIAFVGLLRPQQWSRFVLDLDENAETLLPFDLVRYEEASGALRSQIDEDGILLYERSEN